MTIDINWHPCCLLKGEAKDLMGIESELFPSASGWSLQSCAETSRQAKARHLNCHHL